MEVQTRNKFGDVRFHQSLSAAFKQAQRDSAVWKISFNAEDGTRIRLVRTEIGWVYEEVMDGNRKI